ncbi:MAG: hypothetical protein IKW50_04570 [Oscillospiraceae bacterium]|nr:hypothetical protein [Oscillospiraceae bacterium]
MTEKEKYEQLDKKLRPKYEHLSDDEYLKVRERYIISHSLWYLLRKIFWILLILFVYALLFGLLAVFIGDKLSETATSFVNLLLSLTMIFWLGVALVRCMGREEDLPMMYAGLLTARKLFRGSKKKWETGKYRLVARKAIRKQVDKGGIEDSDSFWLYFPNPGGTPMKHRVTESAYNDMRTGDLYYLVLSKQRNGKEKICKYYKAELTTLDDELQAILQK